MLTRLLKALSTSMALFALCSITPDTARAQGCQTCWDVTPTVEACIFCAGQDRLLSPNPLRCLGAVEALLWASTAPARTRPRLRGNG